MNDLSAELRARVVQRAGGRCEYCRLAQTGQEATFHIDHVVPRAVGGRTKFGNLAFACVSCSLSKSAKVVAVDPESGNTVRLFNPRRARWEMHFRWDGVLVVGMTPAGRATVVAFDLNRARILFIRREEAERGRHPFP